MQGQHRLDDADDSGTPLEMAEVGLHRPDAAWRVRGAADSVDRRQRTHLRRVAGRCSGAVRLDEADAGRRDVREFACPQEHVSLRHRAAAHHRELAIAVANRIGEALEHHHARARAAPVAVGVEGLAPPVRCGRARLVEHAGQAGTDHRADAARKRERRLSCAQHLACLVHRNQGRGACGGGTDHANRRGYRSVVIANGSSLPLTRMSIERICAVGMLVAADNPDASSPAGFQDPTAV